MYEAAKILRDYHIWDSSTLAEKWSSTCPCLRSLVARRSSDWTNMMNCLWTISYPVYYYHIQGPLVSHCSGYFQYYPPHMRATLLSSLWYFSNQTKMVDSLWTPISVRWLAAYDCSRTNRFYLPAPVIVHAANIVVNTARLVCLFRRFPQLWEVRPIKDELVHVIWSRPCFQCKPISYYRY